MSGHASPSGLSWQQALVMVMVLASAAWLAYALTPRERLSQLNRDVILEAAIPRSFKAWRIDPAQFVGVVNPQQESLLKVLYSQTLSRTYVNDRGQRVMLSIAYGGSQGNHLELHRPEVCYVSQGFELKRTGRSTLQVPGSTDIPLQRLWAEQRGRSEPISYWMRVGDDLVISGLSQQLSRIRQGLNGKIPDGVLFRVSSIDADAQAAYILQEQFVQDLMASLPPHVQQFFLGPVTSDRNHTAP